MSGFLSGFKNRIKDIFHYPRIIYMMNRIHIQVCRISLSQTEIEHQERNCIHVSIVIRIASPYLFSLLSVEQKLLSIHQHTFP